MFLRLFWIYTVAVLYCNCQTTTLTHVDPDVVEGSDITFVCTVSSAVNYVNWLLPVDITMSYTTTMGAHNGRCALGSTSFLYDTTKYSYTCTNTVYQVTVKNVQRSQRNSVWSCFPQGQSSGPTSTITVQVPVSSVSITPSSNPLDVTENTTIVFTCQTSASRPDASVTWHKVESGVTSQINQNITSSTTNDDFSVTTSTLRFAPSRQQDGAQIFCKAENRANTSPIQSARRTLNVVYEANITSFSVVGDTQKIVEVNENDKVHLECIAEGVPSPNVSLRKNGDSFEPVVSKTVDVILEKATCSDAGLYICSTMNVHNAGMISMQHVYLFVRCTPRAKDAVVTKRKVEMDHTVTFIFNAVAYPYPTFTWWQLVETEWKQLSNGINIKIESLDLLSNLTITAASQSDFTFYKVIIKNKIGVYEQTYELLQWENSNIHLKDQIVEYPDNATVLGYMLAVWNGFILLICLSFCLAWKICSGKAETDKPKEPVINRTKVEEAADETAIHDVVKTVQISSEPLTQGGMQESSSKYETLDMENKVLSSYSGLENEKSGQTHVEDAYVKMN